MEVKILNEFSCLNILRCPLGAVGIFNGHFFSYFIGVPHGCQIDLVELFLEVTKE